jgi:hypothetical protein
MSLAARAAPLVHDGPPEAAISVAAAHGGAGLSPTPLDSLRAAAPVLLAGGAITICAPGGPPDAEALLRKAEGALLYARYDEAQARIAEARNAALCASQTPGAGVLARIELFAGLVAEEQRDDAAAEERYRVAIAYDPKVEWPQAYPPERRARFDEVLARGMPATTTLQVRPSTPPATIDGHPADPTVPVGEHVVRIGAIAVRVTLDEAPNKLIVPTAYPPESAGWMGDDARKVDLTALLAATMGEGTDLWLVHDGSAWHGLAGRTDWDAFPAEPSAAPPVSQQPPPSPAPGAEPRDRGRSLARGVLTGVVGLGLGIGGTLLANDAAHDSAVATPATWGGARNRYYVGAGMLGTGWTLCGVGATVTIVGLVRR